ncbi:extracellular solute-binding protein [Paenibacillus sp. sptzw28]|uniref:extracellular solute-binding protein n=1 Tax=Paenibacillus sp. sptzw28 TaxID=715179 RepID=UPI001C6E2148|nr:extracellular solute-binding protein [Paenibacillus sp. sptzw28]QYR22783.1 extracellular solute-binding protein [Paenibacillus sp. sptzw28]
MADSNKTRRFKKSATLTLALVLICTLVLSACSSNSNSGSGTDTGSTGDGNSSKEAPVTLKVEVFDRGASGVNVTNNWETQFVNESFGKPNNINVQYVPVPRSEEVQKLNVLMASGGDVPDIVFTYDTPTFNRYAEQGGLTDLAQLLDQHGPDLKKFLGDDTLAYGQFDGKQYAIPAKRANLGKYASAIRKDWLDKLGLPVPKTTDELYNTLVAFKEKDPGKTGGKVIPLGMTIAPAQIDPLVWSFIQPTTDEQKYTLTQRLGSNDFPILLPGFKDALQFMNKLYNAGLMSKDFSLDKDKKQMGQDISNGLVGFFSEDDINPYYPDGMLTTLDKNVPGANMIPVDAYSNSEGKHPKPRYAPNGMYIMIPKSSERAAEAIKYLNWMASGDNLMKMQNGIEGENYTLNKDGIPVAKPDASDAVKKRLATAGDMAIVSNGMQFGSDEKNREANSLKMDPKYQEKALEALNISNSDTFPPVLTSKPIEAETKYGTTLEDKYYTLIVKTTMVKPNQFESTYEAMIKDYMQSGGQAILDERTADWKAQQSK